MMRIPSDWQELRNSTWYTPIRACVQLMKRYYAPFRKVVNRWLSPRCRINITKKQEFDDEFGRVSAVTSLSNFETFRKFDHSETRFAANDESGPFGIAVIVVMPDRSASAVRAPPEAKVQRSNRKELIK